MSNHTIFNGMFTTIPQELEHPIEMSPEEQLQDFIDNHCPIPTDEDLAMIEKEVWE